MLGISYFELSRYKDALPYFQSVSKKTNKENLFLNHGKWYTCLTLILLGQTEEAQSILNTFKKDSEFGFSSLPASSV